VLFICQFGTVKSAIARELLKRRAAARGISVIVSSRGITPEAHLAPSTRSQLLAEGIDLDGERLQKLRRADLDNADLVVTFNPLPASMRRTGLRDWSAVPSVNDTYLLARVDLDRRVDQLLEHLSQMRR
jgi:protein-tyrosine-phosphatase